MDMVRKGLDIIINIRVEVRSSLAVVPASLCDMEQVWNHARFHNALAMFVEIDAPGIARAFAEKLEDMFGGMIPPDARIDRCAPAVRCSGLANFRMSEHSLATI